MKNLKETFVLAFAIFGCVFGAGNLILPPMLGFQSGLDWWMVAIGFLATAVLVPYLALIAFTKIKGTIMSFGSGVSKNFGLAFGILIYLIALSLPIPRTAAVTHEIAIHPFFNTSEMLTSAIYFGLVLILALNRNKIMTYIGAILTPVIVILLLILIMAGISSGSPILKNMGIENALSKGILEGYQTFDALGGIVAGAVMVLSIKSSLKNAQEKSVRKIYITSSRLAMGLLLSIYLGLMAVGAKWAPILPEDISRTQLLGALASSILGPYGGVLLAILIAAACFTTAVSVVVGAADFMKQTFKESEMAYTLTIIISCILGILIGQFPVAKIIQIALPILLLVYPAIIVMIVLNCLPKNAKSKLMFRSMVFVTLLFALPSSLESLGINGPQQLLNKVLPFGDQGLIWIAPAMLTYFTVSIIEVKSVKIRNSYLGTLFFDRSRK